MSRRRLWPLRATLALVAGGTLVGGGPANADETAAAPASLGGFQGRAAASGLHAFYNPAGVLPIAAPVDLGAPDALATISTGPATFARASVADPGDLLANPDALLQAGIPDWESGTIPPYPYRVSARSGIGAPSAESTPAPGLNARVRADDTGSRAEATMPALDAPAILTVGSMSSTAMTTGDGTSVSVHARSQTTGVNLLGILTIDSVVTDLSATSDASEPTLTGGTTIIGASVLGQPVTIDAEGVHGAAPSGATDRLLGAVTEALTGDLDDLLANAGIRVTVAGPVEQAGNTSGQLAAAGLRIDLELSERTVPVLATLTDALPPIENPLPGVPSVEDLLALARARHLVALQVAGGAVSLAARPVIPSAPTRPAESPPASTGSIGSIAPPSPATDQRRPAGPAAPDSGPITPSTPGLASDGPAESLSKGIGAVALVVLLLQPFVGDRLAWAARTLLAPGPNSACPREKT